MPNLRDQTLRSSLFVIRESLNALRQHLANLDDPASIDRVIREAEIMSTSLKKLHAYLGDEPKNHMPTSVGTEIELGVITNFFDGVREQRLCPRCGGLQSK